MADEEATKCLPEEGIRQTDRTQGSVSASSPDRDRGEYSFDAFASYSTAADYQLVRKLESFLESFHRLRTPEEFRLHKLEICVDGSDFSLAKIRRKAPHATHEDSADDEETKRLIVEGAQLLPLSFSILPWERVQGSWVDWELEWFLTHRDPEKVFVAVTHGRAPWEDTEAFFPNPPNRRWTAQEDLVRFSRLPSTGGEKMAKSSRLRRRKTHPSRRRSKQLPGGAIKPLWHRQERRKQRLLTGVATIIAVVLGAIAIYALIERTVGSAAKQHSDPAAA